MEKFTEEEDCKVSKGFLSPKKYYVCCERDISYAMRLIKNAFFDPH